MNSEQLAPMFDPNFLEEIFKLKERRVMVVGGIGILGRAIAEGFCRAGCQVAITSTQTAKGARVARQLGLIEPHGLALTVNALDRGSLERARDILKEKWGGVDVLVNAVGGNDPRATVPPSGSFFDLKQEAVEDVWRLNFLAGALLPFLVLLARAPKRNCTVLGIMSVWMLAMHYVDLHWIVMPTLHRHGFHLHWLDLATFMAVGSLFALTFWYRLKDRALTPVGDPRLEQSLEFKNV